MEHQHLRLGSTTPRMISFAVVLLLLLSQSMVCDARVAEWSANRSLLSALPPQDDAARPETYTPPPSPLHYFPKRGCTEWYCTQIEDYKPPPTPDKTPYAPPS